MGKLFCIQSAWSTGLLLVEFRNEKRPLFTRRFVSSFFRFLLARCVHASRRKNKIKKRRRALLAGEEPATMKLPFFQCFRPKRDEKK